VYVASNLSEEVRALSPGIFALLDARYRVFWSDEYGTWYELASVGPDWPDLSFPGVSWYRWNRSGSPAGIQGP
jgi:hypothetical protein